MIGEGGIYDTHAIHHLLLRPRGAPLRGDLVPDRRPGAPWCLRPRIQGVQGLGLLAGRRREPERSRPGRAALQFLALGRRRRPGALYRGSALRERDVLARSGRSADRAVRPDAAAPSGIGSRRCAPIVCSDTPRVRRDARAAASRDFQSGPSRCGIPFRRGSGGMMRPETAGATAVLGSRHNSRTRRCQDADDLPTSRAPWRALPVANARGWSRRARSRRADDESVSPRAGGRRRAAQSPLASLVGCPRLAHVLRHHSRSGSTALEQASCSTARTSPARCGSPRVRSGADRRPRGAPLLLFTCALSATDAAASTTRSRRLYRAICFFRRSVLVAGRARRGGSRGVRGRLWSGRAPGPGQGLANSGPRLKKVLETPSTPQRKFCPGYRSSPTATEAYRAVSGARSSRLPTRSTGASSERVL